MALRHKRGWGRGRRAFASGTNCVHSADSLPTARAPILGLGRRWCTPCRQLCPLASLTKLDRRPLWCGWRFRRVVPDGRAALRTHATCACQVLLWLRGLRLAPVPRSLRRSRLPVLRSLPAILRVRDRLHDECCAWAREVASEDGELRRDTFRLLIPTPLLRWAPAEGEFVHTSDPRCVRHVLKNAFEVYGKGGAMTRNFDDFLGSGIFNQDHRGARALPAWRMQRKVAAYEFSVSRFKAFAAGEVAARAEALTEALAREAGAVKGETGAAVTVDVQDLFARYTLDAICAIAFGADVNSLADPQNRFAADFDTASAITVRRFSRPHWRLMRALRLGDERVMRGALARLDDFCYNIIAARQARPVEEVDAQGDLLSRYMVAARIADEVERGVGAAAGKAAGRANGGSSTASGRSTPPSDAGSTTADACQAAGDYGQRLSSGSGAPAAPKCPMAALARGGGAHGWNVAGDHGDKARRKFLRDVVVNFLIAGRDTTANALSWAAYRLAANPRVAARCRQEAREALGDKHNGGISYEALKRMPYTHATVLETLRLHPSVPQDLKQAARDDVWPDGTFVRKGSLVSYDAYTMGRNEELWEAPLEFRPERFLKPDAGGAGGVAVVTPDLFKFTAFQAGPRRCLGMDLALLEAKAAIGAVLRRFELCLPAGAEGAAAEPPAYRYALTLPVLDGMCLEVRPLSDY